jgi:hypothetical protein
MTQWQSHLDGHIEGKLWRLKIRVGKLKPQTTSPEVRWQILSSEYKLTQAATLKLAKLAKQDPTEVLAILEEVRQAPHKNAASAVIQRFISKSEEIPMNKQTARLIDFQNATDAINWLKRRFTAAELAESLARPTTSEDADDWLRQDSRNVPLMDEIDRQ